MRTDRQPPNRTDPGFVLLVSCYELGHQPIALASAAGFLRRAGFDPATLDLSVESLDPARVGRPALVAISVPMHTALRIGVQAAARIRALAPDAQICFFGHYASLNADWLLAPPSSGQPPLADTVIGGESESTLVRLADVLAEHGAVDPFPVVEGARRAGHSALPVLKRLDFAAPDRSGLPPLERYAKLEAGGETRLAAATETSRGCKHLCTHCPVPPVYSGRFFAVPLETVLSDIARLVEAGATHITFADPDFLNGPAHARRVTEAMHARFPDLTYDFTAKIEHLLDRRLMLPELKATGCLFVVSAVESLAPAVLDVLKKGHTRADVDEALALTRAAGIVLRPSLLPFTPWSTLADYRELLEFVLDRDLADQVDPIQLTIRLLVPPGSLLESDPAMLPHRRALDPATFSWAWAHPDPRMDALQKETVEIVSAAVKADESPEPIFRRLLAATLAAQGVPPERESHRTRATDAITRRPRAPRLTEPWFC